MGEPTPNQAIFDAIMCERGNAFDEDVERILDFLERDGFVIVQRARLYEAARALFEAGDE